MSTGRSYELDPEDVEFAVLDDVEERRLRLLSTLQATVALQGPRIFQEEVAATVPLPVDVGTYRRSADAYSTPTGAVFMNHAAHASIVEEGRRPGRWPPRDVIERWVRRKFRLRLSDVSNRRKTRTEGRLFGLRKVKVRGLSDRDRAIRSIAFLVARKIARQGIPGKHVMLRTERRLTKAVDEALTKAARG